MIARSVGEQRVDVDARTESGVRHGDRDRARSCARRSGACQKVGIGIRDRVARLGEGADRGVEHVVGAAPDDDLVRANAGVVARAPP